MNDKSLLPSPEALAKWASNRSVALLLTPELGSLYVASAIPIEICGRYFLATAAHNLNGISRREQIRALPAGRRFERPLYIVEWNSSTAPSAERVDVGLATSSVPPDSSSLPFQEGIDLLVQWPPPDLGEQEARLPEPAGVSGGGLWLLPLYAENPGWTFSDLRLVATIRAWRREARQLVTTRIEHWLKLLAEDRPYTRKEIDPLLEVLAS
jgi:hypothetical protein